MDTARDAPVDYDSGDASVVVGSAVNRQTDAATHARVDWRRTASWCHVVDVRLPHDPPASQTVRRSSKFTLLIIV